MSLINYNSLQRNLLYISIVITLALFIKIVFLNEIPNQCQVVVRIGVFFEELLKGAVGGLVFYFIFDKFYIKEQQRLRLSNQTGRIKNLISTINRISFYSYYLFQEEGLNIPKNYSNFKINSDTIDYNRNFKNSGAEYKVLDDINRLHISLNKQINRIRFVEGLEGFENQLLKLEDLSFFRNLAHIKLQNDFFNGRGQSYILQGKEAYNLRDSFAEFLLLREEILESVKRVNISGLEQIGINAAILFKVDKN